MTVNVIDLNWTVLTLFDKVMDQIKAAYSRDFQSKEKESVRVFAAYISPFCILILL